MAENDKSFKRVDLTNLDKATPEEVQQIGHIVGIKPEKATSTNVKATLYAAYEGTENAENMNQAYANAEKKAREKLGPKADAKQVAEAAKEDVKNNPPLSFRQEMLMLMQSETKTDLALGSLKYNELIDFMQDKGLITAEKATEYKKPADDSTRRLKEFDALPEAEKAKRMEEINKLPQAQREKFFKIDTTGKFAALYDYGVQTGYIDTKQLQGMMENSIKYSLDNIEKKPISERTEEMQKLAKMLKEDLGLQMKDGSGAKQNLDDARTKEALDKAKEAKGK